MPTISALAGLEDVGLLVAGLLHVDLDLQLPVPIDGSWPAHSQCVDIYLLRFRQLRI